MVDRTDRIHSTVASYYSNKVDRYGPTPSGVDWNGEAGQRRRFEQFDRLFANLSGFSIIDQGCGYGAYFDYLSEKGFDFSYLGIDLSERMIAEARLRMTDGDARFKVAAHSPETADFTVASGIFNVRGAEPDDDWLAYILETLDVMASTSRRGFAFNCLTLYSDPDRMRPDLYYADPLQLFDHCRRRHSRELALLHDYGLYEFTILVQLS
jgi:SAM-dependent methyltransferase